MAERVLWLVPATVLVSSLLVSTSIRVLELARAQLHRPESLLRRELSTVFPSSQRASPPHSFDPGVPLAAPPGAWPSQLLSATSPTESIRASSLPSVATSISSALWRFAPTPQPSPELPTSPKTTAARRPLPPLGPPPPRVLLSSPGPADPLDGRATAGRARLCPRPGRSWPGPAAPAPESPLSSSAFCRGQAREEEEDRGRREKDKVGPACHPLLVDPATATSRNEWDMPWPPAEAPSSPGSTSSGPGLGSDVSSLPAALLARAKTSPLLHLKASPSLTDFVGVKPPRRPSALLRLVPDAGESSRRAQAASPGPSWIHLASPFPSLARIRIRRIRAIPSSVSKPHHGLLVSSPISFSP
nr:vegetative cell wall protein gp1-like [Aegilops tauschii subsp. strangulata]